MLGPAAVRAKVRDAVPADAEAVASIGKIAIPETFRDIVDPVVLSNIVEQSYAIDALQACITRCRAAADAHFIVAELEGRVVGFLHYDSEGLEPELHRIYLEPGVKRRGIGSALLRELHERLSPGASYILMVIAANVPAVRFYQRHGLVEEERVDGPTYMSEHMGVIYPTRPRPAPALVMRFTKSNLR
jgi:ribosomal protein S18 acetylase RimI-like enzyme